MIPGKYDITIFKGGTWSISLEAASMDFASYDEIRMQIRPPWVKGLPQKAPLLELTQMNGRVSLQSGNQQLVLQISAADTAGLSFDEGVYDLELVKHVNPYVVPQITEEIVDKLLYGSVTVKGETTV